MQVHPAKRLLSVVLTPPGSPQLTPPGSPQLTPRGKPEDDAMSVGGDNMGIADDGDGTCVSLHACLQLIDEYCKFTHTHIHEGRWFNTRDPNKVVWPKCSDPIWVALRDVLAGPTYGTTNRMYKFRADSAERPVHSIHIAEGIDNKYEYTVRQTATPSTRTAYVVVLGGLERSVRPDPMRSALVAALMTAPGYPAIDESRVVVERPETSSALTTSKVTRYYELEFRTMPHLNCVFEVVQLATYASRVDQWVKNDALDAASTVGRR